MGDNPFADNDEGDDNPFSSAPDQSRQAENPFDEDSSDTSPVRSTNAWNSHSDIAHEEEQRSNARLEQESQPQPRHSEQKAQKKTKQSKQKGNDKAHGRQVDANNAQKMEEVDTGPSFDNTRRERDLDRREKELERREKELERRQKEVEEQAANADSNSGKAKKNWPLPKVLPLAHHDLKEIKGSARTSVRLAYFAYMGLALCLFVNFICSLAAVIEGKQFIALVMAVVYLVTGLPGAWFLWYRRVYFGAKRDSSLGYIIFFLFILVNIAFCAFAAVSPPFLSKSQWSLAGWLVVIKAFDASSGLGVIYVICAALFSLEAVYCFVVLQRVHSAFRNNGHSTRAAREEMRSRGQDYAVSNV